MKLRLTLMLILAISYLTFGQNDKTNLPSKWYLYETKSYDLYFSKSDSADIADYLAYFDNAHDAIEKYFGKKFLTKYEVYIHPNRSSLDLQWSADWNMPGFKSECWMVGSGVADQFDLLSPKVWKTEACEHDPSNILEIQKLITHETVHVFHGQINLNHYFDDMQDMSWFIEGVAILAAGQLDEERMSRVRTIVNEDRYPRRLASAWEGNDRYGICGSLVSFIKNKYGDEILNKLLEARSNKEVLTLLKTTEKDLFSNWAEFVGGK